MTSAMILLLSCKWLSKHLQSIKRQHFCSFTFFLLRGTLHFSTLSFPPGVRSTLAFSVESLLKAKLRGSLNIKPSLSCKLFSPIEMLRLPRNWTNHTIYPIFPVSCIFVLMVNLWVWLNFFFLTSQLRGLWKRCFSFAITKPKWLAKK